jgi:hypothetical protein
MNYIISVFVVVVLALSACSTQPEAQVRTPGVLFFYTDG